jgi:hypothetical protein
MKRQYDFAGLSFRLATFLLIGLGLSQFSNLLAASEPITLTVTAVGNTEQRAPIPKDDVQLLIGNERKQIGDWKKSSDLFLAILIDDSIDANAAGNWDDLKGFILAQPATVHIAVGYIRNGTTTLAQDFTPDHELASKGLRMPVGTSALGSSPYLGTIDLLKSWPQTGPHRSVLLISSGIDFFRGRGNGPIYPDVDPLIQIAQRQNTNVWTLYYPSAGHRRSFHRVYYAQNNLGKVADETGAEFFYLSSGTPVSLKPYLDEIAGHLNNQYLLTFVGSGGPKGEYQSIRLKSQMTGLEYLAANAVYVPPPK